nr:uncharacterized mitochondrial protein AtMg00810-like [Tanacetum cinerariifolium]
MSVRTKVGLGFNNYIRENELGWDDSAFSVFTTNSEDVEGRPLFNRFAKTNSIKAVPPPLSRDYTSLSDHIDLDESQISYGIKSLTSSDSKSVSNDFVSCDDSDKSSEVNTNDFASSDSSVKSSEPKPNDSTSCASTSSFVPQAVLLRTGMVNIPFTRPHPVPTGKPKVFAPVPTGRQNRPFLVPTDRGYSPSVISDAEDEGVFDSGCSRSMTGRITRKGTIRTPTLDFENVYYVKELQQFNLFSISQIFNKKNKVLFTDTECLVLSKDFKLPDESMVHKDETYPILKDFINLVENQLNKKTEAVRTACYVLNRVLVTSPHNKTPYALLTGNIPSVSYFKPFGYHVTILNTSDHLGKFDSKADEGYIVGYSASNKAYRVYNVPNKRAINMIKLTNLQEHKKPQLILQELARLKGQEQRATSDAESLSLGFANDAAKLQKRASAKTVPSGSIPVPTGSIPVPSSDIMVSTDDVPVHTSSPTDSFFDDEPSTRFPCPSDIGNHDPSLGIFSSSSYDDEFGAALNNVASTVEVSPVATKQINTIHPQSLIIGDHTSAVQTRSKVLEDPRWVDAMQEEMQQFKFHNEWVLVDLPVVKALYGLHQAPRAWYAILSTFLLKHGYRRGTIDKTLFLKKNKRDIILVQVYMDDIIFGSTKKARCLQVQQRPDGIFINQDKYVQETLNKFDLGSVRTATTPYEAPKPKSKNESDSLVNIHLYRSMIGSLMYLTASRPDIMFAVSACSRNQVTPTTLNLEAVKKIFKYLKGQPKLGLWYPRESPLVLEAYSDSGYARANKDRKSTTGGCQFLGRRLISWQCKKQTIMATSSTEAEYVAAANCCGQPHGSRRWISGFSSTLHGSGGLISMTKHSYWSPELGPLAIQATIDKTPYTITEDLIRSHLQLADNGGIDDLPIAEIYSGMDNLGRQFNWSSYIFKGMVSNIGNAKKFLMYPRFLQTILGIKTRNKRQYKVLRFSRKLFANMRLNFEGHPMPLLAAMLSQAQEGASAGVAAQAVPQHMPAHDQPQDHMSTPPRQQTSNPNALIFEHGQSSDPNIASFSRTHETDADPFTNVEDKPLRGSFHMSPPSFHSCAEGQGNGSKAQDHKRKMVVSDSDQEEGGKQDVDLDALLTLANAAVTIDFNISPGGASDNPAASTSVPVDVPTGASNVPTGSISVPADVPTGVAPPGVSIKGKALMVEEDIIVKERTFKQMQEDILGKQAAKRLHDEVQAQVDRQRAELQRKRHQEVLASAMYYTEADWINIIAQNAALIKRKKQALAEKLAQERKDRPMTQGQQRTYMRQFVKNQSCAIYSTGWSMARMISFTDDQLKEEFEKIQKAISNIQIQAFSKTLKRIGPVLEEPFFKRQKSTEAPIPSVVSDEDSEDEAPRPWSALVGWEVLFDSHEGGKGSFVWQNQHLWEIRSWRLYTLSNVNVLETVSREVVFMFTDVSYPLSVKLMERMLTHKLEIDKDVVGNDMTTAEQLIRFIKNQLAA